MAGRKGELQLIEDDSELPGVMFIETKFPAKFSIWSSARLDQRFTHRIMFPILRRGIIIALKGIKF
jgi:hypothetical protein